MLVSFVQADNPKWGMHYLQMNAQKIICVNMMWQSSRTIDGPDARQRSAWCENSLALKLVQHVEMKYAALTEQAAALAISSTSMRPNTRSVMWNNPYITHGIEINLYTHADMMAIALTSFASAQALPLHYENAKTLTFLRRMAWHKTVGEVLESCWDPGQGTRLMYTVAGQALHFVERLSKEKICSVTAPLICPVNAVSVAIALTRLAMKIVLTSTELGVFQKFARRVVTAPEWAMVERIEWSLAEWAAAS